MSLTSKSIRLALEIKDKKIIFTKDAQIEQVHEAYVSFLWALTVRPDSCPECGFSDKIVRYGYTQEVLIVPGFSYRPTYL